MQPLILPAKGLWAGFTGTREGLTTKQWDSLTYLLRLLEPCQVQHGDCVGADEAVHHIALAMEITVAIRPPIEDSLRAWSSMDTAAVTVFPTKPYLQRNHDIVNHTNYLVACPSSQKEVLRSGTWATIRYAGKHDRVTYLVYPNGQLDRREPVR